MIGGPEYLLARDLARYANRVVVEVIEAEGEASAPDETIEPSPRRRTPDPSPEQQARDAYRRRYDLAFGRALVRCGLKGKP